MSTVTTPLNKAIDVTEPSAMIARLNEDTTWQTNLTAEERVEWFNIAANAMIDGNLYGAILTILRRINDNAKSKAA